MRKPLKAEMQALEAKLKEKANAALLEEICTVNPVRIVLDAQGVVLYKPCGAPYLKDTEVHCDAFKDGTCEYLKSAYNKKD